MHQRIYKEILFTIKLLTLHHHTTLLCHTVGSGRSLDGLGKELSLQETSDRPAEDVPSSSECPELSVEEMTTSITDTSSSVNPHNLPSTGSNDQTTSLDITTNDNSTATANSCDYGNAEGVREQIAPLKMVYPLSYASVICNNL